MLLLPLRLFPGSYGVVEIKGPISPPLSQYVQRAIAENQDKVELFVLTVDTPGGLDQSMREIVKTILASRVPVVGFIYPKGARAASAGTFIIAACHIAAMAPGTSIGAAHPVMMGMGKVQENSTIMKKALEDAVSYIRSLAKMRGRKPEGYVKAVKEASSFDTEEALKMGMIDVVAEDLEDLMRKINGRLVKLNGKELKISSASLKKVEIKPSTREKLLEVLGNPNIAYLMLILGFYGIFFELTNPGAVFPGVLGGIFLVLGLYSMHVLPINYAGLILILLSFLLFLLEIKVPSHGVLTLGGIVSFVLGSLFLIENPYPYLRISLKVILSSLVVTLAFFFVIVQKGISALRKKPVTGAEGLIGEIGRALTPISNTGKVFVHGEIWDAWSDEDIDKDDEVEVVEVRGLRLKVRKKEVKDV